MSVLFTGDWQADFSNLDLCDQAWNEVISIANERDVDTVVFLGDQSHSYNPVDSRVMIWWQNKIRDAIRRHLTVIMLKGNHDRIGQYADSGDKLPLYKRAGAIAFSTVGTYKTSIGTLMLLPYMPVNETRVVARKLQKNAKRTQDILCFHQDVKSIYYNRHGSQSDAKLTKEDLFHSRYRFCVGGHVHFPQRFGDNCYYVGSPFCQDWGEVNQRKRYLVISKDDIKSVHSEIPRWFDPSVDGFERTSPSSWNGARVRISVACDVSKDYGRRLEKARRRAEKKYPKADIYVVPKFKDNSRSGLEGLSTTDPDKKKVELYVNETANSRSQSARGRIVKYMLQLLQQAQGSQRNQLSMKFISAKAENFLSYRRLQLNLHDKGLVLVEGKNSDRGDKSNGAGKTSLVQTIPVALFGRTFKDQRHDGWANRFVDESATVSLRVKNSKGEVVRIIRGRRPPVLRMELNGNDISSGMKSNDKDGTQNQIEAVTGFSFQTLANAVYIDRGISDSFLSGTKRARTDVLSKFQNLERFGKALELVRRDIKGNEFNQEKVREDLAGNKAAVRHQKKAIHSLKEVSHVQLEKAEKDWRNARKREHAYLKATKPRIRRCNTECRAYEDSRSRLDARLENLSRELSGSERDLHNRKIQGFPKKECPTCHQKVSKAWIAEYKGMVAKLMAKAKSGAEKLREKVSKARKELVSIESKHDKVETQLSEIREKISVLHSATSTLHQQYKRLVRDNKSSAIVAEATAVYGELKSKRKGLKTSLKVYTRERRMQDFVQEAFSRDGIPAFLNRLLCPVLNKASDYYAELFSNREIQLQFVVEEGEFVPKVINTKGGQDIDDQSTGERALAGLIASFALRECAPRCNLLILDEPGEGLDSQTAKQFARSLQTLKERFGLIIVATHNVNIMSELNPDRVIKVVKHNRISKVRES